MIASILAFVFSPLGRIALIGLAIMAAVVTIDRRATYRERAKCDAAAIRAERDAMAQDLKAERDAREREKATILTLEQQKEKDDADLRKLADDLAKRPVVARCNLDDDDARRLQ